MNAQLKKFLLWRACAKHGHLSRILLHLCTAIRSRKTRGKQGFNPLPGILREFGIR